jgi:hypothetical protein
MGSPRSTTSTGRSGCCRGATRCSRAWRAWTRCTTSSTGHEPGHAKRRCSRGCRRYGPGYTEARLPFAALLHPLTGLCAVHPAGVQTTLKLGPCNPTDVRAYVSPTSTLVLRDAAAVGLVPCLVKRQSKRTR